MTLPNTIGAVRSIRFSNDNTTLAVAEPGDYVHLYDLSTISPTKRASRNDGKGYSIWNEGCSAYDDDEEISVGVRNEDEIMPEYGGRWVNVYWEKDEDLPEEKEEDVYQSQVIDFIGEIAGISFTPDSQSLFISVADTPENPIGCIFEYERT
jgi:hypothetical protein